MIPPRTVITKYEWDALLGHHFAPGFGERFGPDRRRALGVGDMLGGERALPWSQVQAFAAKCLHLNTDLQTWAQSGELDKLKIKLAWDSFYVQFQAWKSGVENSLLGGLGDIFGFRFIAGENLKRYESFVESYNELFRQFKEAGGQTTATSENIVTSPIESFAKGAESAVSKYWPWAVAVGLVLVGGYLMVLALPTVFGARRLLP